MNKTRGRSSLLISWLMLAGLMATLFFTGGCKVSKDDGQKVRDLEFTVVGDTDMPAELRQIITEKAVQPFKLTFSDEQNLFIAVGYGPQATGGYSIAVHALYLTSNSIVIDTELLGPEKGENPAPETSYPYVVVKTENLENPVIFQ
ncbi:MAG: protease complex subunit PrcB family protein [Hungatella sp.]|nr:protease complex subunit PrcB family protein [Hungatella sp.]